MKKFKSLEEKKEYVERNIGYYSDYFECLFWADIEQNEDIENANELGFEDIDLDSAVKQIEQLDDFFSKADDILAETDYVDAYAQHDFYLTRCGHGAGFWEAEYCTEEQGEILTELAKSYGEVYISVDNGIIYLD